MKDLQGTLVEQTPATFTLELKIYNEWEGIRSFVSNYYTKMAAVTRVGDADSSPLFWNVQSTGFW